MEWIVAALVILGAATKVATAPTECEKKFENPCKHFLARQIDYDECMNHQKLKQLEDFKL